MIVRSCTPRSRSTVAAVWRASWSRPSRTPAALSSFFQLSQSVRGFSARPISSLKIHPSSVKPVAADAWDQVHVDRRAVALIGALLHKWPREVFEPMC